MKFCLFICVGFGVYYMSVVCVCAGATAEHNSNKFCVDDGGWRNAKYYAIGNM